MVYFIFFSQEKALALKIGRQKKIQIIDGQHVEVFTGDDEEDEEDEEYEGIHLFFEHILFTFLLKLFYWLFVYLLFPADEDDLVDPNVEQKMMAVEGQDGQQYVVLEVIQLPENAAENNVDIKPKITGVKSSPSKPKLASPVANTPKLANSEKVTKLGTYSIIYQLPLYVWH